MNDGLPPTKADIKKAIETINELAIFAAIHGCFTEPVPELVYVMQWLEEVIIKEVL